MPLVSGPETEETLDRVGLADSVATSRSKLFSTAFSEGLYDTPEFSTFRMSELYAVGQRGPKIDRNTFQNLYGSLGLEWDEGMTFDSALLLAERKRLERRRAALLSRSEGDLGDFVSSFGGGIVGSLLSPVNIVTSFIPVFKGLEFGRKSAQVLKAGSAAQLTVSRAGFLARTATRGVRGLGEGFVGGVLTEPFTFAARNQEQADYGLANSVYNVLLSTALGSGLHVAGGTFKDLVSIPGNRRIANSLEELDVAMRQGIEGKKIEVSQLRTVNALKEMADDPDFVIDLDMLDSLATKAEAEALESIKFDVAETPNGFLELTLLDSLGNKTGLTIAADSVDAGKKSILGIAKALRRDLLNLDPKNRSVDELMAMYIMAVSERNRLRKLATSRSRKVAQDLLDEPATSKAVDNVLEQSGVDIPKLRELEAKVKDTATEIETLWAQKDAAKRANRRKEGKELTKKLEKAKTDLQNAKAEVEKFKTTNKIDEQRAQARERLKQTEAGKELIPQEIPPGKKGTAELDARIKDLERRITEHAAEKARAYGQKSPDMFDETETLDFKEKPFDTEDAALDRRIEEDLDDFRDQLGDDVVEEIRATVKTAEEFQVTMKRTLACAKGKISG